VKILVAGVGNIFFGDDGFGPEVLRRLRVPDGVRAVDFGIRGVDLAFAMSDGWDAVILVDAAARGGAPGTLYLLEPNGDDLPSAPGHGFLPGQALELMRQLGGSIGRLRLVACEPESVDEAMGLSEPVAAAVEPALALIGDLIQRELAHA
jgi:hydrogenase maturation protease